MRSLSLLGTTLACRKGDSWSTTVVVALPDPRSMLLTGLHSMVSGSNSHLEAFPEQGRQWEGYRSHDSPRLRPTSSV